MNHPQYQQYPPPPYPMWGYQQPPARHGGLSITGMVLGIVSLVLCFTPFLLPPILTTAVGLVLSIVGRVQARGKNELTGCATAGIVCNGIAAAIIVLGLIALSAGGLTVSA